MKPDEIAAICEAVTGYLTAHDLRWARNHRLVISQRSGDRYGVVTVRAECDDFPECTWMADAVDVLLTVPVGSGRP